MNRLSAYAFCLLSLAFLIPHAAADAGWVLMTADMQQQPVSLQQIGPAGVRVVPVNAAQPITISFDSFLQIDRTSQPRSPGANLTLILLNGDRLTGHPVSAKDEQVTWHSPSIGDLTVPLKQIRALIRYGSTIENLDQPLTEDKILLSNGDTTKGIVTDISDSKVTVQAAAPTEIPLDSVKWIQFALAAKPAMKTDRGFRIRLNDDSLISADSLEADDQKITLALPDGSKREVAMVAAAGIEQLNGPLSWLSSGTPQAIVQVPYFGGTIWPTRMDSTVGGKPIQFADRIYARGIGVHAYSRIDYALDGSYEAFRTQYAIAQDEKRQYANVAVRIKIDGKTVHEQPSFTADLLSPVLVLDLPKDAKMLRLEVDYGQANDTQDRFNWIEPALLRKKPPKTQPATPTTQNTGAPSVTERG